MKNRKIITIILIIVLLACIIPVGYAAVSKITKQEDKTQEVANAGEQTLEQEQSLNEKSNNTPVNNAVKDNVVKAENTPKKEINIAKAQVSKETQEYIKNKYKADSDKHLSNYIKFIEKLNVPETYNIDLEKLIKNNHDIVDIFTAYDFLNDNYGKVSEIEDLLKIKEKGKAWEEIFSEYNSKNVFEPKVFEKGYLESVLKDGSITYDDIMIADRVSKKMGIEFNDLILKRKSGESWGNINSKLGIINTSNKLPKIIINSDRVKKQMDKSGLSKEEVIDSLIIADKFEQDEDEIISKTKEGKKKEIIYSEIYNKKYR